MTNITQTPAYRVAFSMYVALGGDKTRIFDSVEAIYAEIDKFYGKGSRITTESLTVSITENGSELYNDDAITGYKPVRIDVNVPQKYTDEQVEDLKDTAREEGYTSGYDKGIADGYVQGESEGYTDGYAEGLEDGAEDQKALLEEITIIDNGVYEKEDGYKKVTVEVPIPEIPTFETQGLSITIKENGDYSYSPNGFDGYNKVDLTVEVPTGGGGDSGKPKIYNGFYFSNSNLKDVDFSQYDWSNVYDMSNFFSGCSNIPEANFRENFNGKMLSAYKMFNKVGNMYITSIPNLGDKTKDCLTFEGLFCNNTQLQTAYNLQFWNTSKVKSCKEMFYYCNSPILTSIPSFDTSNVVDMNSMFKGCTGLTEIPKLNTSKVVDFSYFMDNCNKVTKIDELDTSSAIKIDGMFASCTGLRELPDLNFSKCGTFGDVSGSTSRGWLYSTNGKIEKIGVIDCDSMWDVSNFIDSNALSNARSIKLTDFGGFRNLGKNPRLTISTYFINVCTNLTHDSLVNILNGLYDRASAGYSVLNLDLNSSFHLSQLSEDEIAIATNKGWTVTA